MTRASLDKQPAEVAAMFDRTAARYDLLNDLMTGGMDRRWRREVVRAVGASPGELVLDLAAGTGTSSVPFAEAGAPDRRLRLLSGHAPRGRTPPGGSPGLGFTAGDALRLPFGDASFDAVTISFGIRNVKRHASRAGGDAPGDQAGRSAADLRGQPPAEPRAAPAARHCT